VDLSWILQGAALLTLPASVEPMRFGALLPVAAVADGLSLRGPGVLQWRRLPVQPRGDRVWVEIAVAGAAARVRVLSGGQTECADGRGPAFVRTIEHEEGEHGTATVETWSWCDGTIDVRRRQAFVRPAEVGGERFVPGEFLTESSAGLGERAAVVVALGREWAEPAGLLPAIGGGGPSARDVRRRLAQALPLLPRLPGMRGRGDFVRSGGVVTNLEYDTTFALLRAALGLGDATAFAWALEAAEHLADRDLDAHSGLPFPHGPEHRTGRPEPGHAWLQGLLWVGLATADDQKIWTAQRLAHALAAQPPAETGRRERLRDHAWPLLELEALLVQHEDPVLARAADRLAATIGARFDAEVAAFRFGEGEAGRGVWFERAWLTAGLLLPALDAHLRRRPDASLRRAVEAARRAVFDRCAMGPPGLPTHWRTAGGQVFAEHREAGTGAACWLLEAASSPRDLDRLLRRGGVREAIGNAPLLTHDDIATEWTLVARTSWVWR
jgi:hypothetical protein